MKECAKDIVAFGLNQVELDLTALAIMIILGVIFGRWLLLYLNHGLETKEERWERKNPFLSLDKKRPGILDEYQLRRGSR